MKPLRILYISHSLPPEGEPLRNIGGMQNVSRQLMRALQEHESVELRTVVQKVPWSRIGSSTFFFLFRLLREIPRAEREFEPDVILFSSMVTAGVLPFMGRRVKAPTVAINHGQDVTLPLWIYQRYLPHVFARLSHVISVSDATRQASIDRGLLPEKGMVLPNGLDEKRSDELPAKSDAKTELAVRFDIPEMEQRFLLLTVGRHVKRKGHAWFIEHVLPRLESRVNYLIVGDGPEHENIQRAVRKSGHSGNIILTGRQPEDVLRLAYAAADLFVMPNIPVSGDMEGFGIVLLEANQSGLPAVASDLEGIRDVIQQGVNGYRVPHLDPVRFSETVDRVLAGELTELSDSARSYALEKFNWKSVVEKYVNFLSEIAYERPNGVS